MQLSYTPSVSYQVHLIILWINCFKNLVLTSL